MEQLFIAPKIKVGFQKRDDTYTKMLAYIIYYDLKGVLRKEKSWSSWRDNKIAPVEFDNVPTEGFVLNKKVGGHGYSHWNARQEYVRVYDPRNFEFEITVPNLLFILSQCDCSRGKGLEGKFVYAWSGTTLVLLPVSSEEYKKSSEYTGLQDKTITSKELVKGVTYLTRTQEKLTYLDRRFKYNMVGGWRPSQPVEFMHVFWDEEAEDFVFQKDTKRLAVPVSDTVVPNYAELVEKYDKSMYGSAPVRLFTKKQPARKVDTKYPWTQYEWAGEDPTGVYHQYSAHYDTNGVTQYVQRTYSVSLQDNILRAHKGVKYVKADSSNAIAYAPNTSYYRSSRDNSMTWVEPNDLGLWVELASGSKFKVSGASLVTKGDRNG